VGFDPASLDGEASLNKLVIGRVRGAQPAHLGEKGGDLLGRDAIVRLLQQRCGVDVRDDAVSDWLAAAIAADRPRAAGVVDEVGDRLASLLATLRDPATAAAAAGGRRTYLEVWQTLDAVVLGGGLMKGVVGERVAARAAAVLTAGGADPPTVRVARHPEWLALVGAARSASGRDAQVIVLDGGQTSIKRGIAQLNGHSLVSVRLFAPVPVSSLSKSDLPGVVARSAAALRERHPGTAPEVMFSVASYVRDGKPVRDRESMYEQLDPASMLSAFGVRVRLMHDGSAAWRGADTEARSAVIMLGTWLGVGIGPHRERLCSFSPGFTIETDHIGA